MDPKVIKNNEEYEHYLSELSALLDLDPDAGTPEGDRLELLALLLEDYEKKEFPIDLPDPIEAIKFRMEQQNLRQKDLIPFIGSASKVSEVLNGKRQLSKNMIRALHENLQISAEVLMSSKGAGIPDVSLVNWNSFPLKYMYDKGWFKIAPEPWAKAKDMAEELVKPLWQNYVALCTAPPLAKQTRTIRAQKNADIYSLTAWALRVIDRAKDLKLQNPYRSIDDDFMMELARLSFHSDGPRLAMEFLGSHGISLIIEPHLAKTFLDGAALMMKEARPVLALTIRRDRIDNFWFCLLHELAHIAKHLTSQDRIIIDDLDLRGHDANLEDKLEKEADEMTRDGLIPKKVWEKNPLKGETTAEKIISLAEKLKIHPAIIAGRVRHERNNYRLLSKLVGSGQVRKHFAETNLCPVI